MKWNKGLIQSLCCVGVTAFLYACNVQGDAGGEEIPAVANVVEEVVVSTPRPVEVVEEDAGVQETSSPPPKETEIPQIIETVVAGADETTATGEDQIVDGGMEGEAATAADEAPSSEPVEEAEEYVDFAIADVRNYVNVRSGPDTDSEIVGKIYGGAVAQIVETAGAEKDWFQIISGNVEGFIKSEYFIHGQEAAEVMDSYVVKYAQVQVKKLNVRAEASTGAKKAGYLEYGETARVLEDCGEWLKIQYTSESEGYVSSEYVNIWEDYSYALSQEEEKENRRMDAVREDRKPIEQKVPEEIMEEVPEIVVPSVTYTSNEELRKEIIDYALQFVGNRYINGGSSLTKGTDCAGFTCFIYKEFGYSISRTPSGQYSEAGRSIDLSEVQPGDIICYSSNGGKSCTHVAFYMGDGKIVHSANSRKGVITSDIDFEPIIGVRNVID